MSVVGLCSLSIVCTVFVLSIHHHTTCVRPPNWMTNLIYKYLSRILCVHYPPSMRQQQKLTGKGSSVDTVIIPDDKPTKVDDENPASPNHDMHKDKVCDSDSGVYDESYSKTRQGDFPPNDTSENEHISEVSCAGRRTSNPYNVEWIFIAKNLDRLFLCIFLILLIGLTFSVILLSTA